MHLLCLYVYTSISTTVNLIILPKSMLTIALFASCDLYSSYQIPHLFLRSRLFCHRCRGRSAVTTLARSDAPQQPQPSKQLPLPFWAGTWLLSEPS